MNRQEIEANQGCILRHPSLPVNRPEFPAG
jgi:hypothetical protein